jgi:radical SAM superfamily enzyme YgiQ (UPF0313 family)
MHAIRQLIERRLTEETLLLARRPAGALRLPLCYPSPYHVGMSSLGFQVVYRVLSELPDVYPERAFLPDDVNAWKRARLPLVTYESQTPVGDAPAILFSVAYELELTGLFSCLELSGVPVLAAERGPEQPIVICGGPLTFSNPLPLGPFVDAVVIGEGEEVLPEVVATLLSTDGDREARIEALGRLKGVWVPALHGEILPPTAQCDDALLPATSVILTPNTELRSMFLVEPERGCSRGCTYCVMRRSTNGGMRLVPPERLAALLPRGPELCRVGLVGAAVTDHPRLANILRHIVDERGLEVGISSLRADRLNDEIVGLLRRGGYKTLTVAADGASERLREIIERKTREKHLMRAAELAASHRMQTLKVYMMVGLPDETEADVDELCRFGTELSRRLPTALGVAPFVAKRNTPLDGAPFAGIAEVERRLERLRRGLASLSSGRATVRPTSARWAWVEYVLAQGAMEAGLRAYAAHQAGGGFSAWRRAFEGYKTRHERDEEAKKPPCRAGLSIYSAMS